MAGSGRPFEQFKMSKDRSSKTMSETRKHFVAAQAEFVGTFFFLFFAFIAHQMVVDQAGELSPSGGNSSQTVVFISLIYGFSLLINAWTLYRVSGGLFNPAVTLGMAVAGQLPIIRALCLFPAQILGGIIAAALASCIVPGPIANVRTSLAPGVSIAQGVFLEMFLTSLLVFVILMLAAEKSKDTFIAPIGIGIALFVAELAGVGYTGGSLNPARSFGPAVASASFHGYHYIYWFGPIMGALLAAAYYRFLKYMHYEDCNPGQDDSDGEE